MTQTATLVDYFNLRFTRLQRTASSVRTRDENGMSEEIILAGLVHRTPAKS